jgi:hypothetical protein
MDEERPRNEQHIVIYLSNANSYSEKQYHERGSNEENYLEKG